MATQTVNLGRVRPVHQGTWATGTEYKALDIVKYQGITYICRQNAPAGTLPTNGAYFDSIADPVAPSLSQARIVEMKTPKGQSTFMYRFPAFNLEDVAPGGELGTGLHPAFLFNGVAAREIYIGAYPAAWLNNEVVCQPGLDPRVSRNFDQSRAECRALGAGWDIMSNWDWAAVAFWCVANGYQPLGNTNYGCSHSKRWETGTRVVDFPPGTSTGGGSNGRTLTGSGPASWAHDGSPGGIFDLVGNVWEWSSGLILQDNIFRIAPDNGDYADADYLDTQHAAAAAGAFSTRPYTDPPLILKQALAVPASTALAPGGNFSVNTAGERLPVRGGAWNNGATAGLGALYLSYARSYASSLIGFRPRFRNL